MIETVLGKFSGNVIETLDGKNISCLTYRKVYSEIEGKLGYFKLDPQQIFATEGLTYIIRDFILVDEAMIGS